jgi:hypothetical protein
VTLPSPAKTRFGKILQKLNQGKELGKEYSRMFLEESKAQKTWPKKLLLHTTVMNCSNVN